MRVEDQGKLLEVNTCLRIRNVMTEERRIYSTTRAQTKSIDIEGPRTKAEREFYLEKRNILNNVDDSIKKDFRKIGFARWCGKWLPMIQLSPYDIPSGRTRDSWMKMYNKVRLFIVFLEFH